MGIPKGCYDVIAWHLILSIILTSVLSEEEVGIAVSSSAHGGGSLMQGLIYHGNVKNKQLLKEKPWKALGDLSASEAQFNEDTVYKNVQSGRWPAAAWTEYNFLAATGGNVDTARQLLEFWAGPYLHTLWSEKGDSSKLHKAVALGDLNATREILESGESDVDERRGDGTTALVTAALFNTEAHAAITRLLLQHGANVEATGDNGMTPLQVSASLGHTSIMVVLLEAGADANAKAKFAGATALHYAAEMGHDEAVEMLCRHRGTDVEAEKLQGIRAIHVAADCNRSSTVGLLLGPACRADPEAKLLNDTTPLYLASQKGWGDVVRVLLENGANPNFAMPLGSFDTAVSVPGPSFHVPINSEVANGATALHAAAEEGHTKVVRILLEAGASQDSRMQGSTPLHVAVMYNRDKVVKQLAKHAKKQRKGGQGASSILDARVEWDGSTALLMALGRRQKKIVRILLEGGADPDLSGRDGTTALIMASGNGDVEFVKLLLKHGAKIDARTRDGTTATLAACDGGHTAVVSLLLSYNPDITAKGPDGQSPLHIAINHSPHHIGGEQSTYAIIEMLLRKGGDVKAKVHSTGATALHMASKAGYSKVCEVLLSHGADVNSRMKLYQATSLHLAAQNNHIGVVHVLLRAGADVNAQLDMGSTALMIAVERDLLSMARLLLKNKADVSLTTGEGYAPIHLASMQGNAPMVELLLEFGSNVNVLKGSGSLITPLVLAVQRGQVKAAEVLLKRGADRIIVKPKTEGRHTPKQGAEKISVLEIARQERNFDMIKLLSQYEETESEL